MRPASIVWFERIYLASFLVGLTNLPAAWEPIRMGLISPVSFLIVLALSIGIALLLVLLISRRRSNVAKWILVVLFAIGILMSLPDLFGGGGWRWMIATLAMTALQIVATSLLFTASARAWLSGKTAVTPSGADLQRTFE